MYFGSPSEYRVHEANISCAHYIIRQSQATYITAHLSVLLPPQCCSQAVVCFSTLRRYPRSGSFLVKYIKLNFWNSILPWTTQYDVTIDVSLRWLLKDYLGFLAVWINWFLFIYNEFQIKSVKWTRLFKQGNQSFLRTFVTMSSNLALSLVSFNTEC